MNELEILEAVLRLLSEQEDQLTVLEAEQDEIEKQQDEIRQRQERIDELTVQNRSLQEQLNETQSYCKTLSELTQRQSKQIGRLKTQTEELKRLEERL